jgi:hypothetical protein
MRRFAFKIEFWGFSIPKGIENPQNHFFIKIDALDLFRRNAPPTTTWPPSAESACWFLIVCIFNCAHLNFSPIWPAGEPTHPVAGWEVISRLPMGDLAMITTRIELNSKWTQSHNLLGRSFRTLVNICKTWAHCQRQDTEEGRGMSHYWRRSKRRVGASNVSNAGV